MDVLAHLLRGAPPARSHGPSVDAWFERLAACPFDLPIDRALWSGFEADRLGYAFVGGYEAALEQLFLSARTVLGPSADAYAFPARGARLSLAATETGGAHPRAITTTLNERSGGERDELVVRGEKTFATLASAASEILVVASAGAGADGKNRLRLVRVRSDATGLTIEDRKPTPFAPEVPHARVAFVDVVVRAGDVLPGDGYDVYLKPFRTIEDAHVLAAALGHLIGSARSYAFAESVSEGAFALAIAVRDVAAMAPSNPGAHVALAGLFGATRRLIGDHDAEWEKAAPSVRDRWRRDLGLLLVAETARQKRTEAAWKALATS